MKNNYLYQGNYAEYDEDIGWHDFALRSYDAQIGRFWQTDPYDEFASGYTGMGNDPVNMVDPSGGWSLGGFISGITGSSNVLFNTAAMAAGGALIGGIVDFATGGNGRGALIGAGIGAGLGLASGINWGGAGSVLGGAVPSLAANAANQFAQYASNNNSVNEGQLRSDGSRMFTNQNDAYSWMFNQSMNNNYREQFGVITDKSVLVLPDNNNTQSEVIPEDYGYKWKKGNLFDPVTKKTLSVVATIHTHLAPWGDATPSFDDQKYFPLKTPNKPYLTMGNDGKVYGNYGKWSIGKDGKYHTSDIQNTQIAFDRGGVPRVTNGAIMKSFSLREYLQWYMKNVAKIK